MPPLPGFGAPLLLCTLVGLVTITTLNFYGASLTLLSVIDSVKPGRATVTRRMWTLAISTLAATGLALASTDNFVQKFGEFLAVLLYLFTPWTAVNLVDFYWVRRGHYSVREIFNPHGMYGRWNWRGLIAYGDRIRVDDSVLQRAGLVRGAGDANAGRGGYRHAGGSAGVDGGLSVGLPFDGRSRRTGGRPQRRTPGSTRRTPSARARGGAGATPSRHAVGSRRRSGRRAP